MLNCDLLIKNGEIATATDSYKGDIAIKNGKIIQIGESSRRLPLKISSRRAVSARRLEIHRRVARTVALRAVGGIDRRVCVRRSSSALLPCKAEV